MPKPPPTLGRGCMLFTCLPEGAPIPGRFPGPAHARGKWFTVDIHCHVLTPKAEEMVAGAGLTMDWQPRHQFANEHTKEVNREQARRTRVQFTSGEKRLEDMDRMGIDIQAITPSPAQTFYSVPADLGIATARVINDNLAEICGKHPDRFVGLGTVPFRRRSWRSPNWSGCINHWGCAASRSRQMWRAPICRSRASGRSLRAPRNWGL